MILDTGDRTPYASGAVRDMKEGKSLMNMESDTDDVPST